MIVTIKKVSFGSKYIEFWTEESETLNNQSFDLCSKIYKFWEAVHKADLFDEIINTGVIGKKLQWIKDDFNYEIDKFV